MASRAPSYADRYDKALAVHAPYAEGEAVLTLRRRLMTSRDLASQALSSGRDQHSGAALAVFRVVLHVSGSHCFRPATPEALKEAADLCVRLLQCTSALARMEAAHGGH